MSSFLDVLGAVAEDVRAQTDELNRLDGVAGDGDMGVTMRTASQLVIDLIPALVEKTTADALTACGAAIAKGAPSTAGTLVATGLLRAGGAARQGAPADPPSAFAELLDAARAGIAERGRAEPGSKTMLDALYPAVEAARRVATSGGTLKAVAAAAAAAADEGARATASMRPQHGRAAWLSERSAGYEDAGARLVAIMLGAASRSIRAASGETGG